MAKASPKISVRATATKRKRRMFMVIKWQTSKGQGGRESLVDKYLPRIEGRKEIRVRNIQILG